ncbi:DUF6588 family protein [Marinilabilia sp.]|jgi:hypothetical protein
MKRIFLLALAFVCMGLATGQDLEDYLSKYTQDNGKKYLQPFADAFSADLNSGLFRQAVIKKNGFQLYIGVVGQMAVIPDDQKHFQAYTESSLYPPEGPHKVPTVFGPKEAVIVPVEASGGLLDYAFPAGFNVDYMPLATPQITIGSLIGTDFTVRYITLDLEDLGDLDLFGWGIRHSLSQYLTFLPVDVAIGYYRQSFKIGDYMDASASMISLQGSYSVPVITFYGGLGIESSSMDVQYTYSGEGDIGNETIKFEMEGANNLRFTIGLTFNLGPVKINGDYNIAKQNTLSAGVGIGINQK